MTPHYVTLMAFETPSQADFHREMLDNAGIPCRVSGGDALEVGVPEVLPGMGGAVRLEVAEEDLQRASELLGEQADGAMGDNPAIQ